MFDQSDDRREGPLLLGRPWLGAGIGLLFSLAEFALCAAASLSGHGSYLPAMLVFGGPPLVGALVWTAVGALLGCRHHRFASVAGLSILALNVAGFFVMIRLAGPAFSVAGDFRRVGLAGVVALLGWAVAFLGAFFLFVESLVAGRPRDSGAFRGDSQCDDGRLL